MTIDLSYTPPEVCRDRPFNFTPNQGQATSIHEILSSPKVVMERRLDHRDRLVGLIYQAALDSTIWPTVMLHLANVVKSEEATLVAFHKKDGIPVESTYSFTSGRLYSPEAQRAYRDHYSSLDLLAHHAVAMPPGELLLSRELVSEEESKSNKFFQEFLVPNGVSMVAGWNVENDNRQLVAISFHSGKEFAYRRLIAQSSLMHHIRRSLSISADLQYERVRRLQLHQMLHSEGVHLLIVDRTGKLLECSKGAEVLLNAGRPLRVGFDGQISASEPSDKKRLLQLIHSACDGGKGGILLGLDGQGNAASVHVRTLPEPACGRLGPCCSRSAWILVRTFPQLNESQIDNIRTGFGCTRAEAEVGAALARGLSPKQIAGRRQVSLNTVHTQIRHLFTSCNVNRVADFIVLFNLLR